MRGVISLQEAGEQYGRQISIEEIEGFETRTQIPVPEFIREAKVITPAEAYEFAVTHLPVPDYPEEYRFLSSIAGLRAIRENGGSIEAAGERLASPRVSLSEVALALESNAFDKEAIISQETRRRNQRDKQLLVLEAALVRKYYGIEVQASTLAEYAQWIAETAGDPNNHLAYYAHILGHYNPMTSGLSRSFNPTKEWVDYFEGGYDIRSNWNLNSSNTGKLDFYSRFVVDAAFPDFHAVTREDGPGLLTHTTSLYSFDAIWKAKRLGGTDVARVCFSDGRFTASPKNIYLGPDGQLLWEADEEVALVFDKETITRLYIALPMAEPFTGHEQELRSYEQIDPRLAIGVVPMSQELFPSCHGNAYGKVAVGAAEMEKALERYQTTGKLFDAYEASRIKAWLKEKQRRFEH